MTSVQCRFGQLTIKDPDNQMPGYPLDQAIQVADK
jgi:hypothetical protein